MSNVETMQIHKMIDIGQTIRARRKEIGMCQKGLSRKAGVGVRFISELENGKVTARFDKVMDVLVALDISIWVYVRRG